MSFDKILNFRKFVLNEDNAMLKTDASKIVEKIVSMKNIAATGIVELNDDLEDVFTSIQSMLNGKWLKQQKVYLVPLQTVAYNLKLLSDGDDEAKEQNVASILQGCEDLIRQQILDQIEGPVNKLAVPAKDDVVPETPRNQTGGAESGAPKVGKPKSNGGMGANKSSIPPLGQPTDDARPAS